MSRHSGFPKHDFSRSPMVPIPRTRFNRSHGHKTTIDAGYLYPIYVDEALPGDICHMNMTGFARISTLLFPIMDNLHLDVHWFFVPSRLLWTNWEVFNGANIPNTNSSTDYILPQITSPSSGGFPTGSIFDYMGLPTQIASLTINNVLPLRGYVQIYNDWYRDQNFNDMVTLEVDDGPDPSTNYTLLQRNKRHDYFTSCLPFPQKGPAVALPLTGDAPVIGIGFGTTAPAAGGAGSVVDSSGSIAAYSQTTTNLSSDPWIVDVVNSSAVGYTKQPAIFADLSDVTATTINQLRLAATTQQMYEQDARGGTRYTEILQSHFQTSAQDFRLQRAEFLSSHSQRVGIHAVAQTAPPTATDDTPQANLAAFGTVVVTDAGFTYSFLEHGYVYGIVSVRADYTYQQGIQRFWNRSARFDFYWPSFANIGEMAVLNWEIYATGTSTDTEVFGYQGVWDEYRYMPSRISGIFRSNASGTLDAWHLAQQFGSLPTLNDTFIAESPPMSRIEAVADQPDFICDFHFNSHWVRPMPMNPVPGIRRL